MFGFPPSICQGNSCHSVQVCLPGNNCSVFYPVYARGIQLSRPSLVKKPNNCSIFGPVRPGNSNLCCAGSAVTAASWSNCEQLFGFLTSNFQVGFGLRTSGSDSGSDLFGIGDCSHQLAAYSSKKYRTIPNFWPKIKKKR